jgi:hypothetical protein
MASSRLGNMFTRRPVRSPIESSGNSGHRAPTTDILGPSHVWDRTGFHRGKMSAIGLEEGREA